MHALAALLALFTAAHQSGYQKRHFFDNTFSALAFSLGFTNALTYRSWHKNLLSEYLLHISGFSLYVERTMWNTEELEHYLLLI
jgi:hypothetical protein